LRSGARRGTGGRSGPERDPARQVAYELLRAVAVRGAYANLTLPALLRARGLTGRDAAFSTELSYGALRAQGTLDAILARCSDRPLSDVDGDVLDVLRLGAYQLLRTRVPAHAAVSATVALAPRRATGFVNAVLRRVAARDWAGWLERVAPPYDEDPIGNLAIRYPHPDWVVAAFRDALGGDLVETERALAGDDARPETHLVARPGRIGRDELVAQSGGEPGPWSPWAVRLAGGGDPGRIAAVRDGRAGVQDEGSQLCALAMLAAPPAGGPDARWLDLCAGPGGKAALLGALAVRDTASPGADGGAAPADAPADGEWPAAPGAAAEGALAVPGAPSPATNGGAAAAASRPGRERPTEPAADAAADAPAGAGRRGWPVAADAGAAEAGARVLAVDVQPHRAGLVAAATAGLPVDVVVADGAAPAWAAASFDRVLVDAPCSGLGALRRRPEARWRRRPEDLPALTRLQRALLHSAIESVRPGGVVAYVTCSPHPAETLAVVAEAVRREPVEQIDARPLFPGVPDLGAGPHVQLWPHRHGTDAMFAALLRRTR
jgi:16S rRNA (cytosine967-C5)-methyltransferase